MPGKPGKLLVIDVGNSEIVVGVFSGDRLSARWRLASRPRTADEIVLLFETLFSKIRQKAVGIPSVLSSVVPPATLGFADALEDLTGSPPFVVGEGKIPGLAIRFLEPSSVGPDRLANAMAVRAIYGKPAIVVDLGTATTFDVVGSRGEYLGGAIAPGVLTSSEDLFRRAARLSRVEMELPKTAIGKTTAECLQSGILLGTAGMVDSQVRRIAGELGKTPRVVATGGLASLIAPACETVDAVDEWLTLQGLRLIHEATGGHSADKSVRRSRLAPSSATRKSNRRPRQRTKKPARRR